MSPQQLTFGFWEIKSLEKALIHLIFSTTYPV